jgi:ketosteroid isomerase-like protein
MLAPSREKVCVMNEPDRTQATPREIVERLLAGIGSGVTADLADLYAPDAVVELPFAPPEGVTIRGREDLRAHFTRAGQTSRRLVPEDVVFHETTEPEVVVVDYFYRIEQTHGVARLANVQIVRVREGLIVASRDFHDHARLRAALSASA